MSAPPYGPSTEFSLGRIGRVAAGLALMTALGQVAALARELFIAASVGTSVDLDALLVALVVPTMISGLIASGSAAAIVPAYVEIAATAGVPEARRMAGVVVSWTTILGLTATAIILAIPMAVVSIAGPGLGDAGRATAVDFVPFVAPLLLFAALQGLFAALCQIQGRFRPISLAAVLGPLASLLITIALWDVWGLRALAAATTLGAATSFATLLVAAARGGYLPTPALWTRREHLTSFWHHAGPLTMSASVLQFNLLADRAVSSVLAPGSVSALRYGESIVRMPTSVLGPAWSTVIYPSLVRTVQPDLRVSLGAASSEAIRYILAIFIPLATATVALAPLLVEIVYRRGAFDAGAAATTAGVVAAFGPLLAVSMLQPIVVGAHNARRRGMFLMYCGVGYATLNVVLNVAFGAIIGVSGVALSTSLTAGIIVLVMARSLARIEDAFDLRLLGRVVSRATVASLVPGVPIGLVAWLGPLPESNVLQVVMLVGLTLGGIIGYFVGAARLGLTEPSDVAMSLWRTVRRVGS